MTHEKSAVMKMSNKCRKTSMTVAVIDKLTITILNILKTILFERLKFANKI